PARVEEALAWVEPRHREGQPVGQVDVVVFPDEEQVVRGQRHRGVVLLAQRPKTAGHIQDAHLGVVEDQALLVAVVKDDQLLLARYSCSRKDWMACSSSSGRPYVGQM